MLFCRSRPSTTDGGKGWRNRKRKVVDKDIVIGPVYDRATKENAEQQKKRVEGDGNEKS